jgi:hypothetical protein
VNKTFRDVRVTPHDLRSIGHPSPYSKPFQPDVVTSLDVLLSLADQGELDVVTSAFYTHFNGNFIDSYYVVELGFPGIGNAHASGRQGFVYTTENGAPNRLPNRADPKMHMTADINVIHAPDFSYWRWIELGNPYYESREPQSGLDALIVEDHNAYDRGFNLHPPYVSEHNGDVTVNFNIFEPGHSRLSIVDELGEEVAVLFDADAPDLGVYSRTWEPRGRTAGQYYAELQYEGHSQVRAFSLGD